jgi:hypothetical protein
MSATPAVGAHRVLAGEAANVSRPVTKKSHVRGSRVSAGTGDGTARLLDICWARGTIGTIHDPLSERPAEASGRNAGLHR